MKMRAIVVATILVLGLAAGGCYASQAEIIPPDLGIPLGTADKPRGSGTIEAEEVSVTAEVVGRILRISAHEGDIVEKDQELVWLDQALLEAEIKKAEAAVALSEAQLAQLKAGAKPEDIAAAEAALRVAETIRDGAKASWQDSVDLRDNPQELDVQIDAAKTRLAVAEENYRQALAQVEARSAQRQTNKDILDAMSGELRFTVQTPWGPQVVRYKVEEGMKEPYRFDYDMSTYAWWKAWVQAEQAQIAKEGAERALEALLDIRERPLEAQAKVTAAWTAYQQAEADVASAQARLDLARNGATPEQIAVAEANVDQTRAALKALEIQQQKMILKSPIGGLVTARPVNEGELAAPGLALLKIADLESLTLTVYIPQEEMGRVKLGQKARVAVDSFPEESFQGEVIYISPQAEFTPKNVQTKEGRANLVFGVKIRLPNPDHRLKPGMPADAEIEVEG